MQTKNEQVQPATKNVPLNGNEARTIEQTINFGGKTIVITPKKEKIKQKRANSRTAKVNIEGFGELEATAYEGFSKKGNPIIYLYLTGGQPLFGSGIFRLFGGKIKKEA